MKGHAISEYGFAVVWVVLGGQECVVGCNVAMDGCLLRYVLPEQHLPVMGLL
jgi:hypothetical protein